MSTEEVEVKPTAPDLRLKVWKKFHGKFLPKGPLRIRYKALMERWESNPESHGEVTLEELKALLADWRTTQAKGPKPKAAKA